jgi:hypothetical protein
MSICKKGAKSPKVYDNYLSDIKNLEKNAPNIEKLLHFFEEKFSVDEKTKIEKIRKNYYLVTAPLFWCQYTYLISLYTLLIRMGMFWNGKGEVTGFLDKFDKDSDDIYLYKSVKGKILRMLAGEIPIQDLSKVNSPHNLGIVGFEFPKQKEEKPKEIINPDVPKITKKNKIDKPDITAYSKPEIKKVIDGFDSL